MKHVIQKGKEKMTVAEMIMSERELDNQFERLSGAIRENNVKSPINKKESNENETLLSWWIEKYPTLECAEAELIKRHEYLKSLNKKDFDSSIEYLAKCAKTDREIMMLETAIDKMYTDWVPEGAKHEEFKIGTIFRAGGGRFLCTDIGTRTIIAIRYTPLEPENMDGPPYFLQETVWDEFDIEGVTILKS